MINSNGTIPVRARTRSPQFEDIKARNTPATWGNKMWEMLGVQQPRIDNPSLSVTPRPLITQWVPAARAYIASSALEAYTMTNKQEITDFVASHSYLSEVLRDAPDQIRRYFGNAELVLQVNMDSGYEDSGELNLFIRTELNVDDAFAQLDQLRLSWLRGYPQLIQRTFFVTVQRIRNEI